MIFRFYNIRRPKIRKAAPNAAHFALARLGRDFPGTVRVWTTAIAPGLRTPPPRGGMNSKAFKDSLG